MKANDTEIRRFLEGSKQFKVPLFQREYVWEKKDLDKLWYDIKENENNNKFNHFFGSFVTMPVNSNASKVSEYIVVDGQQRLTTIFIILATLRERMMDIEPKYNKSEIDDLYLINQHHPEYKYKLIPTQEDRKTFYKVIETPENLKSDNNRIYETYTYFKKKFEKIDDISELDLIKDTILLNFSIVDIALDDGDDPYLIFETLNGTGVPLTQADLVRNYLFMKLPPENQQKVYDDVWAPLQNLIEGTTDLKSNKKRKEMDNFIRHYLAMDGDVPTFNKVYITFKELVDTDAKTSEDIIKVMEKLKRFSDFYSKFLYPTNEKEIELKNYFDKFNRLEITTAYPLLLRFYDDYKNPEIDFYIEDFIECLKIIETFVVRRAVCRIPKNALNTYFPKIYNNLTQSNIPKSLKKEFEYGTGTKIMPDREKFRKCLKESNSSGKISKYVLEEIEKHLGNKENVKFEEMQLEHIMPQTLTNNWKKDLGDNWELTYKKHLEAIGNLTLTGYNQEYTNKTFEEKRDMKNGFKDSNLKLNRHLSQKDKWDEKEIKERSSFLAKKAIEIWSF